jgi:hypothetical protein
VGTSSGYGRYDKITADGIDVMVGKVVPPPTITLNDHSVLVHGSSNVQIGNSNTQGVHIEIGKLVAAIDHSSASDNEKAEAKSLLKKLSENKLVQTAFTTILGVAWSSQGAH